MSLHWPRTLAGRLALLLALFIVVATASVVGREYGAGVARQVEESYRSLDERAAVAADRLALALAERERLVALWAELETSQDLAVDDLDKRVSLSLTDLVEALGDGTEAIAGRANGTLLSASDPSRLERPAEGLPAFVREALRRHQGGMTIVGRPGPGAVVAGTDVTSQVDGSVLGRIVAWTPLPSFLAAAVPSELGPAELIDGEGTSLARSVALRESDEGYLWGEKTVSTLAGPLRVRIGQPRSEVIEAVRSSGRKLILLGLVFLLLTLPAMLVVVHSATSGLGRLTRAARDLDPIEPRPLPPVSRWAPAEVQVLAEAMGSMIDRLQRARAELARSESLAAVGVLTKSLAHEIRTPLSVLRAGTEMLQRSSQAPRDREVSEMLHAEVERLARLVDDLLVFGRPSSPVPRAVDLAEICSSALSALEGDAAEKGVRLLFGGGSSPLHADPDQLRQVVVNLVTNAVRACERGGTVVVRTAVRDDQVVLEVEDDGVGIPDSELAAIWEPLYTTHGSGNGLGLPIVRQLVEAHGGTVRVDSTPGRGTRMEVALPAHAHPDAGGRPDPEVRGTMETHRSGPR